MKLKDGVKLSGIRPELVFALGICDQVYGLSGIPMVVTSVCDGPHGRNSLHNVGQAADLRTRGTDATTVKNIARDCQARLGDEFDVVVERDHIHVEFQPK